MVRYLEIVKAVKFSAPSQTCRVDSFVESTNAVWYSYASRWKIFNLSILAEINVPPEICTCLINVWQNNCAEKKKKYLKIDKTCCTKWTSYRGGGRDLKERNDHADACTFTSVCVVYIQNETRILYTQKRYTKTFAEGSLNITDYTPTSRTTFQNWTLL